MNRKTALALVEFNSIAHGIAFADQMTKGGDIKLLDNYPTCPGKHVAIISGDTQAVKEALMKGLESGNDFVLEHTVIPNIDPQVLNGAMGIPAASAKDIDALGIVESYSIIKTVEAADQAVKESKVLLVEMRLGKALGGKGYFIITGEIGAVTSATRKAAEFLAAETNLVAYRIIPAPSDEVKKSLF